METNNPDMDISLLESPPRSSKVILKGIEDHHDAITAYCVLMHQAMNEILGPLMYQGAKGLKLKDELVKASMTKVTRHLLDMCEACMYFVPDEDELLEHADEQSYLLKQDSVLCLTDMMMAALDIIHVIHIDMEGLAVWSEENPPEEMVKDIKAIILGIRNLGRKHNFTLKDITLAL
jgi:hypothetical protein